MDTSKMYGLVVGIAEYEYINSLPESVINDAQDIRSCLVSENLCAYKSGNVRILTDAQATKDNLLEAFGWLASMGEEDSTIFIYFSGHGGRITEGEFSGEYLLPSDCSYSSEQVLAESSILGSKFVDLIDQVRSRKMIVILDCCHASGIGHAKDASFGSLKAGLGNAYLEKLKSGRGRVVFASSRESEYSYVLQGERNSVFTKHLLDGLNGGVQSPDGLVRVFDLFHYIQPLVRKDESRQHPIFKCEVEENFPIALALGGKAVGAPELADDQYEYDVFVTYHDGSSEDKQWVRKRLVPAIEAKGVKACVEYRDFALGPPKDIQRESSVKKSRYTLTILSNKFCEEKLRSFENSMAYQLEEEDGRYRIIGVLLDNCTPDLRFRCRTLLGMEDEDEFESNIIKLAALLRSTDA